MNRLLAGLLFAGLALVWPIAVSAEQVPLTLKVVAVGDPAPIGTGSRITLQAASGEDEPVAVPLGDSTSTSWAVESGSIWKVCAEVPGHWVPCDVVVVKQAMEHVVHAWPLGRISGRYKLSAAGKAESPPLSLKVHFNSADSAASASASISGMIPCSATVSDWSCDIPVGAWDVEIRPAGWMPNYFFDIDVPAEDEVDLGTLALLPPASLVGWVRPAGKGTLTDAGRVRLWEFSPGGKPASKRKKPRAETQLLPNGFFQIAGVEPGVYLVEVVHPGYVPAREFPLQLWERSEVELDLPLLLHRPLTIGISVSPARDWLEKPWRVVLERAADLSGTFAGESIVEANVNELGRMLAKGQTPGTYRVSIQDSHGNPFYGRVDVEVPGPGDYELRVDLDLVVVRGLLTFRDEPVAGDVWFGGRFGIVQVEMSTDRRGRFTGVLPRDGWWKLEVTARELGIERWVDRRELRADGRGDAEVEIELPDTEVFGRVVSSEGEPVAGADVALSTPNASRRTKAGPDGEFRILAFAEGDFTLQASDGERTSDATFDQIRSGMARGPMTLVLQDVEEVSGVVRSAKGPVPGAWVDVESLAPVTFSSGDSARTDSAGRFTVRLRPETTRVQVTVGGPGHSLVALAVPWSRELDVRISEGGGTLFVRRPPGEVEVGLSPERLLIFQNGHALQQQRLWQWARGHGIVWASGGEEIEIPSLAPGLYKACSVRGSALFTAAVETGNWREGASRCVEGFLTPGGTLTLDLSDAEPGD